MYTMSKQSESPQQQRPPECSPPAGFKTRSAAAAATAAAAAAVTSQYKTRAATSQTGSPLAEAVAGLPKFSDHKLLDTLSRLNDKRISSSMSTTMTPQRAAELVSGGDA